MSHDPQHLKEANRRLNLEREAHRMEQAEHERECREKLPELAQLDATIQRTVAQAIAAALQRGTDPGEAVKRARQENQKAQARRLDLLCAHGIDPQSLEDTPLCPKCRDTGWYKDGLCECVAKLCVEENLRELGQQMDVNALSFENFQLTYYSTERAPGSENSYRELMEGARRLCQNYAQEFPQVETKNLFLFGGTGLGKTLLSSCVAKEVAQRGYWVVYATAGALFGQYETVKFGRDDTGEAQRNVERYEHCDLLVLDDLGSEMTTPFVQSALYQLLNQRMLNNRHTIISSNLDPKGLQGRYTAQVYSRLAGEYEMLPFFGRDIRLQKRGEKQD